MPLSYLQCPGLPLHSIKGILWKFSRQDPGEAKGWPDPSAPKPVSCRPKCEAEVKVVGLISGWNKKTLTYHYKGVSRPKRVPLGGAPWGQTGLAVDSNHVGSGLTHRTPGTHEIHLKLCYTYWHTSVRSVRGLLVTLSLLLPFCTQQLKFHTTWECWATMNLPCTLIPTFIQSAQDQTIIYSFVKTVPCPWNSEEPDIFKSLLQYIKSSTVAHGTNTACKSHTSQVQTQQCRCIYVDAAYMKCRESTT